MPKRLSILDRPASDAVARIVSRNLDDARRALGRDDAGGLHTFRVALRRARTTLRAYRSWLPAVRRKDRRRLRALARTTNAGRDAEVLLPLLSTFARQLSAVERADVAPLRRRLRRRRNVTVGDATELRSGLRDAARPLRRRLRRTPASPATFGDALGTLLAADAAELAGELAALRASDAPEPCHAARLTVKHVRYLLEPTRRAVGSSADLVRTLGRLQDRLGDLHDLDVLTEAVRTEIRTAHDAPPGLLSIDRLVALHRAELVRRLRDEFIDGPVATLADDLAAVARMLTEHPPYPVAAPAER